MNLTYFINADGREAYVVQQINRAFLDIDQRLSDLEYEKEKKGKKQTIDRAQKMVLLKELGVLDHLFSLGISQKNISKLLSKLIDADPSNIENDLSARNDPKSHLLIEKNYSSLVDAFQELKLKDYASKVQKQLDKIRQNKV